eukprot:gene8838-18306_t
MFSVIDHDSLNLSTMDNTEIIELVQRTLESEGILQTIRAQLRASVFNVIMKNAPHKANISKYNAFVMTSDCGSNMTALIYDFLKIMGLNQTLSVFVAETGHSPLDRKNLLSNLNLNDIIDEPLLLQILHVFESQKYSEITTNTSIREHVSIKLNKLDYSEEKEYNQPMNSNEIFEEKQYKHTEDHNKSSSQSHRPITDNIGSPRYNNNNNNTTELSFKESKQSEEKSYENDNDNDTTSTNSNNNSNLNTRKDKHLKPLHALGLSNKDTDIDINNIYNNNNNGITASSSSLPLSTKRHDMDNFEDSSSFEESGNLSEISPDKDQQQQRFSSTNKDNDNDNAHIRPIIRSKATDKMNLGRLSSTSLKDVDDEELEVQDELEVAGESDTFGESSFGEDSFSRSGTSLSFGESSENNNMSSSRGKGSPLSALHLPLKSNSSRKSLSKQSLTQLAPIDTTFSRDRGERGSGSGSPLSNLSSMNKSPRLMGSGTGSGSGSPIDEPLDALSSLSSMSLSVKIPPIGVGAGGRRSGGLAPLIIEKSHSQQPPVVALAPIRSPLAAAASPRSSSSSPRSPPPTASPPPARSSEKDSYQNHNHKETMNKKKTTLHEEEEHKGKEEKDDEKYDEKEEVPQEDDRDEHPVELLRDNEVNIEVNDVMELSIADDYITNVEEKSDKGYSKQRQQQHQQQRDDGDNDNDDDAQEQSKDEFSVSESFLEESESVSVSMKLEEHQQQQQLLQQQLDDSQMSRRSNQEDEEEELDKEKDENEEGMVQTEREGGGGGGRRAEKDLQTQTQLKLEAPRHSFENVPSQGKIGSKVHYSSNDDEDNDNNDVKDVNDNDVNVNDVNARNTFDDPDETKSYGEDDFEEDADVEGEVESEVEEEMSVAEDENSDDEYNLGEIIREPEPELSRGMQRSSSGKLPGLGDSLLKKVEYFDFDSKANVDDDDDDGERKPDQQSDKQQHDIGKGRSEDDHHDIDGDGDRDRDDADHRDDRKEKERIETLEEDSFEESTSPAHPQTQTHELITKKSTNSNEPQQYRSGFSDHSEDESSEEMSVGGPEDEDEDSNNAFDSSFSMDKPLTMREADSVDFSVSDHEVSGSAALDAFDYTTSAMPPVGRNSSSGGSSGGSSSNANLNAPTDTLQYRLLRFDRNPENDHERFKIAEFSNPPCCPLLWNKECHETIIAGNNYDD